jgi:hypothetical protein
VLYDVVQGAPWRFTGGRDIELLFPEDPPISLSPRGYLLLTKDRTLFESRYGAFPSVPILEWGMGSLSDSGAALELSRPGELNGDTHTWIGVDGVTYSDGAHDDDFATGLDLWPAQADGRGQSLTRIDATRWGDDPLNWLTAAPSPGAARQRPNR